MIEFLGFFGTLWAAGLWFVVMVVVTFIIGLFMFENERYGIMGILLFINIGILDFSGVIDVNSVVKSWHSLLNFFTWYLGIGLVVATAKWHLLSRKCASFYKNHRDEIRNKIIEYIIPRDARSIKNGSITTYSDGKEMEFTVEQIENMQLKGLRKYFLSETNHVLSFRYDDYIPVTIIPLIQNYKGKYTSWVCWWPAVMVNSLLIDLLEVMWKRVYNTIKGTLQRISDMAFGKYKDEIQ